MCVCVCTASYEPPRSPTRPGKYSGGVQQQPGDKKEGHDPARVCVTCGEVSDLIVKSVKCSQTGTVKNAPRNSNKLRRDLMPDFPTHPTTLNNPPDKFRQ